MNSTQMYRSISPREARQMLCDKAIYTVIVDVRRSDEYRLEHIKGAINIPLGRLEDKIRDVVPDLQQEIILYCRTGSRSMEAANLLLSMGYKNVFDLGGIADCRCEMDIVV